MRKYCAILAVLCAISFCVPCSVFAAPGAAAGATAADSALWGVTGGTIALGLMIVGAGAAAIITATTDTDTVPTPTTHTPTTHH
jgi:hypothetical protein